MIYDSDFLPSQCRYTLDMSLAYLKEHITPWAEIGFYKDWLVRRDGQVLHCLVKIPEGFVKPDQFSTKLIYRKTEEGISVDVVLQHHNIYRTVTWSKVAGHLLRPEETVVYPYFHTDESRFDFCNAVSLKKNQLPTEAMSLWRFVFKDRPVLNGWSVELFLTRSFEYCVETIKLDTRDLHFAYLYFPSKDAYYVLDVSEVC